MNKNRAISSGVGLDVILFVVFLVLKLCNVIDWSWWLVTSPLWIPTAFFVAVCIVIFIIGFFIGIIRAICKLSKGRK